MIQKLIDRSPEPRGQEERRLIEECIACFKNFDFKGCHHLARKGLKE